MSAGTAHRTGSTGDITATVMTWWSDLLDESPIGPDDDFFDLGGTSLTLMRLVAHTQQTFGVELPLADLFADDLTPRAVVSAIEAGMAARRAGQDGP